MSLLVFQELELFLTLLVFNFFAFGVALLNGLDLGLELDDLVLLFGLSGLEVGNSLLEIGFTVLSLELLAHGEGDGTLVESLVGGDSHLDFISDSQEEDTTLGLSQGNLADDLVEALGEELFSDGADTALTGLALHQFLVESLSEAGYIDSGSLLMGNIFDEVLAVFNPLSGRQDGINNLFLLGLALHGRQLALFLSSE